jgi:hypothetical protein
MMLERDRGAGAAHGLFTSRNLITIAGVRALRELELHRRIAHEIAPPR